MPRAPRNSAAPAQRGVWSPRRRGASTHPACTRRATGTEDTPVPCLLECLKLSTGERKTSNFFPLRRTDNIHLEKVWKRPPGVTQVVKVLERLPDGEAGGPGKGGPRKI